MILVNGLPADSVPALDRGLAYGDGVFRTLRLRSGRITAWPRHYQKLAADAARLVISCPAREVFEQDLARVAASEPDAVVRITLTRGSGRRGYTPPIDAKPLRMVSAAPPFEYPERWSREGVRVRLCTLKLAAQPRLAGIKHLNRLENVLARAEWDDADIAEGLLCDAEGRLVGGTMTNLFVAAGGVLHTPELGQCGVAGVQRARIIERAQSENTPVRVTTLGMECLRDADEIFLTNSVIGVWPVAVVEHIWHSRNTGTGAWTQRCAQWLAEDEGTMHGG